MKLAWILIFLASCTALSGPCEREVTIKTQCEPSGSVVTFPSPH